MDELQVMREPVRTDDQIGEAADVRVVDRLIGSSLSNQFREPRLILQSAGHIDPHVDALPREAGRARRARPRRRNEFDEFGQGQYAPNDARGFSSHPHTGQIRFAVCQARSRRRQIDLSVRCTWCTRARIREPLRVQLE